MGFLGRWRRPAPAPLHLPDFPDLGELRWEYRAWVAHAPRDGGEALYVRLAGTRDGPDPAVLALARETFERLAERERAAREFVRVRHAEEDEGALELVGLEVQWPAPEWVAQLGVRPAPAGPVSSLQFGLPGARDVLEVTFYGDRPVDAEVH